VCAREREKERVRVRERERERERETASVCMYPSNHVCVTSSKCEFLCELHTHNTFTHICGGCELRTHATHSHTGTYKAGGGSVEQYVSILSTNSGKSEKEKEAVMARTYDHALSLFGAAHQKTKEDITKRHYHTKDKKTPKEKKEKRILRQRKTKQKDITTPKEKNRILRTRKTKRKTLPHQRQKRKKDIKTRDKTK
jgi:hypothetical protein